MTDAAIQAILIYYTTMWLSNVAAYAVVTVGLYRWKTFVMGTSAEYTVNMSLKITAAFALLRLLAGLFGLGLYEFQGFTAIESILILGVTSLFLNTTYIMSHGWFLYRDADRAFDLSPEEQVTVRQAVTVFNSLRRTANAK